MIDHLPLVPLGQAIHLRKEFFEIDDLQEYKRCRVQLHANGVILRDIVQGSAIKTKRQQTCRAGEFLVAEIDAKMGGFGIVPAELEGAIVSSHYFLFEIDESVLDSEYLNYLIRTPAFQEQVSAQGSTNYAAIRPHHVLEYEVSLPPLVEQRRITAQIDEIISRLECAERLARENNRFSDLLCQSFTFGAGAADSIRVPARDFLRLRDPDVDVKATDTYHFAGVYSFGRGVFRGQWKAGSEVSYKRLTRLHASDFVYPKLMAWEGALGIVPTECHGLVVSTEYPVFEIDQTIVVPDVLEVYFQNPSVWVGLSGNSTGTNVRRRRLHPSELLAHEIPIPPMSVQMQLQSIRSALRQISALRATAIQELNAARSSVIQRLLVGCS